LHDLRAEGASTFLCSSSTYPAPNLGANLSRRRGHHAAGE